MTNNNQNKEILYPIRTVLRAWESRYPPVRLQRTAKGHRLYSDREIDTARCSSAARSP